jgi:choice-of-anchor B domain-containing protein
MKIASGRRLPVLLILGLCTSLLTVWLTGGGAGARDNTDEAVSDVYRRSFMADRLPTEKLKPLSFTPCVGGHAGQYPCSNVDLMSFLPLAQIGGGQGSDIWGWTDSLTGKEYALMGRSTGTAFVDISDPENPIYLGNLPTHTYASSWRELKTYKDHAFIVADAAGAHGVQVFDLTQLRDVTNPPVTFSETARYDGVDNVHDITLNEETGFAYLVGSNTCNGGPHIIDVRQPENPTFAGCYSADGYTHDAQCVIYRGPDADYRGREVCLNSNEDTLTILDVTNKAHPTLISRTPYTGSAYTHQGWLTENQRYFAMDDELDEVFFGHPYWTRFWNVKDLDRPVIKFIYKSSVGSIDHNQFIKGSLVYQANYRSGLRVISPPSTEVAFFDIYPSDDQASFNGAWGNFPFFDSGLVIVSGIEQGLFVLRPNVAGAPPGDWLR